MVLRGYHKSILNTLGYDIVETKGEKVTGIKIMPKNIFTMGQEMMNSVFNIWWWRCSRFK